MTTSMDDFAAVIAAECDRFGWRRDWATRLAALTLEVAELIEAVRGKRGDPVEEAGDVLIDVLAIFATYGISWDDALAAATRKVQLWGARPSDWGSARAGDAACQAVQEET